MQRYQRAQYGFTLLELLIAISIFSVLSVMAYGGLKTVLDTREANNQVAGRVAASQITMLRLGNDLRQTVNRSIRDGFGSMVSAMLTHQDGNSTLEWTRSGYSNPSQIKRSHLQRVAYKLDENKLIRMTWPVIDRAQETEAVESILLSGVETLEWRFNDKAGNWESSWPPTSIATGQTTNLLPRAVEVKITFSDLGEVRRLLLLPQD